MNRLGAKVNGELTQRGAHQSVQTGWSVVGQRRQGDILWSDTDGNVAVWLMNGGQLFAVGGARLGALFSASASVLARSVSSASSFHGRKTRDQDGLPRREPADPHEPHHVKDHYSRPQGNRVKKSVTNR
jgi:hypothetical protein